MTQEERARHMSELMHEVDVLEGKLQEASKQRESRLRKVRRSIWSLCRRQALGLTAGFIQGFVTALDLQDLQAPWTVPVTGPTLCT